MTTTRPLNQSEFRDMILQLRQELSKEFKRSLRDVYRKHKTLLVVLPLEDTESTGLAHSIHFWEGRAIRNWLIDYGIQYAGEGGYYVLDDMWAPIAEMALGVRDIDVHDADFFTENCNGVGVRVE